MENNTWARVDMEFLFECLTRHVELKTRREIPYLQETMYHFFYHINEIALNWEEKPI